jgi:hypothetical protein
MCGSRSCGRLGRGLGLCRRNLGLLFELGRCFSIRLRTEMPANFFRLIVLQRTRMSFFLGNPDLRQILDQHLCLDFEFPGEFVDANLTSVRHPLNAALRFRV